MTSNKANREYIQFLISMRYNELTENLRLDLDEKAIVIMLTSESWSEAKARIESLWSEIQTKNTMRIRQEKNQK